MSLSKTEKKLQLLLNEYKCPEATPEQRNAMIHALQTERARAFLLSRSNYRMRLMTQIVYIPKALWLIQGILLILGLWVIMHAPRSGALTVLSVGAPMLGVTVFPVLLCSFSDGMWELEQSARYSLKEICIMRLLIFGVADTCILAVFLAAMVRAGSSLSSYLYWVVVPFALSSSVYLYLIRTIRRTASGYIIVCAGAVLSCASLYIQGYKERIEDVLAGSMGTAVSALLPIAAAIILGVQIWSYVRFIGQKEKGWDEIWNYN